MKLISVIMYTLRVNLFLVVMSGIRSQSVSLNYIDSSIFESAAATTNPEGCADRVFIVNNITDIPII